MQAVMAICPAPAPFIQLGRYLRQHARIEANVKDDELHQPSRVHQDTDGQRFPTSHAEDPSNCGTPAYLTYSIQRS